LPEVTAAELFRRANAARRRGEFPVAKAQYSELIARFPESAEARLARLSLGRLLLAAGDSAEAERTLRGYLADGDRALGEEALVSHAQSLRALGRSLEEQQAWQLLLSRYPSSIYAAAARQRLKALAAQEAIPDP
jgi:TolA-binding protein